MEILPLRPAAATSSALLVRRLRSGGFVPLLADRDLDRDRRAGDDLRRDRADGAPGRPSLALVDRRRAVPGVDPVRAAAAGGAGPVGHGRPLPPRGASPPSTRAAREQIAAMTQACADALAAGIAAHPQDWHMLQRVFVADSVDSPVARRPSGRACAGTPDRVRDRHGLPVLLRRARRGAVPRPGPRRAPARGRPHGERAGARRTTTPRCRTTSRPPGAPSR